jgi:hypothetical protein
MQGKSVLLYKIFVVGVIVLFVGIGIQPAFANVSNTMKSEKDDDCDICPKISNQEIVRLNSMIYKLRILNKTLSLLSSYNSKYKEKYQDFSNKISNIEELSNDLDDNTQYNDDSIFCNVLFSIVLVYIGIVPPILSLQNFLFENGRLIMSITTLILGFICTVILFPFVTLWLNNCFNPY